MLIKSKRHVFADFPIQLEPLDAHLKQVLRRLVPSQDFAPQYQASLPVKNENSPGFLYKSDQFETPKEFSYLILCLQVWPL